MNGFSLHSTVRGMLFMIFATVAWMLISHLIRSSFNFLVYRGFPINCSNFVSLLLNRSWLISELDSILIPKSVRISQSSFEFECSMLQIRLNKGSSVDGNAGANSSPAETVTVACPDHLVLADLPVAKGLGSTTAASTVKIVGRRSRRQLGERVHFCVRCDFPIAIYGRLVHCDCACFSSLLSCYVSLYCCKWNYGV